LLLYVLYGIYASRLLRVIGAQLVWRQIAESVGTARPPEREMQKGRRVVPYVGRSILIAEGETLNGLILAIHGLVERADIMSKYEYLANITEIATEIARAKQLPADDIFRTLASLPRDKVSEAVRRMV